MKRKNVAAILVALGSAAILLAGCGGSDSSSSAEETQSESTQETESASDETWEVSVSTPVQEAGVQGENLAWFAEQVNERTDGRMTINCFYNSTLGDQKDIFTQLSNGEIEMIWGGTESIDYYAPEYAFLTAPYMVQGPEHMQALMDGEVFEGFKSKLQENHIDLLAAGMKSSRNLMTSSKVKFEGLDNISQLVIRVPDMETYVTAWTELGTSTQIMGGGEIYSSMQTGVINACEAPYDQMLELKLDEVGAYVYNTEHVTEFCGLYVSDEWYQSLPEDIQTVLAETAQEALTQVTEQFAAKDSEDLQTLEDAGIEYVEIDTTAMAEKLAPVWQAKFEDTWTGSTYDDVMSYAN